MMRCRKCDRSAFISPHRMHKIVVDYCYRRRGVVCVLVTIASPVKHG